jgi:hypothetical protein
MRLILENNQLNEAPEQLLRQAGYAFLIDRNTGQESFVRRFDGGGFYPRFHLYLEQQKDRAVLNLHLDQKQASYAGAHAHNAEYDGETVQREMDRIKSLAAQSSQLASQNARSETGEQDILDKIRPKQFPAVAKKPEKASWWQFWK